MKQQALVQQLLEGISAAIRTTKFCVSGILPKIDPHINVDDLGFVRMPLTPSAAKRLMAVCQQAPYGKGTQTLVDKKVRNAFELSPSKFKLSHEWQQAIEQALANIATQLGLPADRLAARLYKLLIYGKGGFFLRHRDSEKLDRMVGSMIVALPNPFSGGLLTVRHKGSIQQFPFAEAATEQSPCYAAFYADCEHEVAAVTNGYRLCLAYSLVLTKAPPESGERPDAGPAEELAQSISRWVAKQGAEPLVFALDHHYTQRGLELDLLKGNDRSTAELVIAAAEQANCHTYMCQVERHIAQYADDGNYEHSWRRTSKPRHMELGEIYNDDLLGSEWVNADGKRQTFPGFRLNVSSIIASTPLDQWKPTREEYEGYTGNAGNTLDRWYHRSALCVWHRDHHFEVLARAGIPYALGMLESMLGKLKKTAKKRSEDERQDCVRLARAIIGQLPRGGRFAYRSDFDQNQKLQAFPKLLRAIDDIETTQQLLRAVLAKGTQLELGGLIVAMCRNHGVTAFAAELKAFFEAEPENVNLRDLSWLDDLARARLDDPARDALLAKLARLAAQQFCRTPPPKHYQPENAKIARGILAALLRVLLLAEDATSLEQVIHFVTEQTPRFSVEGVQVPALKQVVEWSRKEKADLHPRITEWLVALRDQLSAATAHEPQPFSDWSRPANLRCTCPLCKQLSEFLSDPNASTGEIRAREDNRRHVISEINCNACDVTHKLSKTSNTHALILTKTHGSFEQRVKRYAADQKLLETVRSLLGD